MIRSDNGTRIVSAGFHMSLDGLIARSGGDLDWIRLSPDVIEHAIEMMRGIDIMLMGRKTYLAQAAHWPGQTGRLADAVNAHEKVVVTSRPEEMDLTTWHGSRTVSDPAAEIAALRRIPGKRIGISGGARLLNSLLLDRLIDEIRVIVHPVTLAAGRSPWPGGLRLRQISTREFDSGAVLNTYKPVDTPAKNPSR